MSKNTYARFHVVSVTRVKVHEVVIVLTYLAPDWLLWGRRWLIFCLRRELDVQAKAVPRQASTATSSCITVDAVQIS